MTFAKMNSRKKVKLGVRPVAGANEKPRCLRPRGGIETLFKPHVIQIRMLDKLQRSARKEPLGKIQAIRIKAQEFVTFGGILSTH